CGRRGHTRLALRVPEGDWVRARFSVGVPFARDHANPATAKPPLAIGAMSWGWQAGYTFIRVDGKRDGEAFRFHLGASRCQGSFTHVTRCMQDNVAAVEVDIGNKVGAGNIKVGTGNMEVGTVNIGVELARLAGEKGRACTDAVGGSGDACDGAFAAL